MNRVPATSELDHVYRLVLVHGGSTEHLGPILGEREARRVAQIYKRRGAGVTIERARWEPVHR